MHSWLEGCYFLSRKRPLRKLSSLRGIIYHDRVFVVQLIFSAILNSLEPALNRSKCRICPDSVNFYIFFRFDEQQSDSFAPPRELPRKHGVQLN